MSKEPQLPCQKIARKKASFDFKLSLIDQINNGQISVNHAAKVSGISRSTISYWKRKLSSFEQTNKTMSKNDEIKKLKERIEELEFVKEVQQNIIADFEHVTGEHLSKKVIARSISKADREKATKPFKVKWLYQCFGISKQAYYKRINKTERMASEEIKIKELVDQYRKRMPRLGAKKLHLLIWQDLKSQDIKMGRDKFYRFLKANQLLVPRTKRYFITTDSKHYYYKSPNRLKELSINHSEQAWVSDITYIRTADEHAYLALVTDAYSKKIMGYSLQSNMKVGLVKEALQMALDNRSFDNDSIIHHSDRGLQYCCPDFSEYAQGKGMVLSTTQQYDPYENAVAERVNGILKQEFGLGRTIPNLEVAKKMVRQAVAIYNNERPHLSLNLAVPSNAHLRQNHEYKCYKMKSLG